MEKLVIDRPRWRRGGANSYSHNGCTALWNPMEDTMCCLGFESIRQGVPLASLRYIGSPVEVAALYPKGSCLVTDDLKDSKFTSAAIDINDNEEITDSERESMLIELFKTVGVEVEFVN